MDLQGSKMELEERLKEVDGSSFKTEAQVSKLQDKIVGLQRDVQTKTDAMDRLRQEVADKKGTLEKTKAKIVKLLRKLAKAKKLEEEKSDAFTTIPAICTEEYRPGEAESARNCKPNCIVIDSDVANEVDDLVAITWVLLSSVSPSKQVQAKSIIVAPFSFRY
jgi:chromosome segregation ATPase